MGERATLGPQASATHTNPGGIEQGLDADGFRATANRLGGVASLKFTSVVPDEQKWRKAPHRGSITSTPSPVSGYSPLIRSTAML